MAHMTRVTRHTNLASCVGSHLIGIPYKSLYYSEQYFHQRCIYIYSYVDIIYIYMCVCVCACVFVYSYVHIYIYVCVIVLVITS